MTVLQPTAILNIVGLTSNILARLPSLREFAQKNSTRTIRPVFPALTCSVQATYLTGLLPTEHGIVGNGWYFKELSQVWFWRQSHHLLNGEKIWETAKQRNPRFTCANLFWWFNMYSSVDFSATPRPIYRANGLKLPDIYTHPPELRSQLQSKHGEFPLFQFWGPNAGISSSDWIARASIDVAENQKPSLLLVYLPHLDYCLQREGPLGKSVPNELALLDTVCKNLIRDLRQRGYQIVILSEYGIQEVQNPIRLNTYLREKGWLAVRDELGEDHFDAGSSQAFAVADHQIAHIYVKDPHDLSKVRRDLENLPGIEKLLDRQEQEKEGLGHPRSGDLVAVANRNCWFSYRYWLEDRRAPDYAPTVDIHRKPGYDPAELFLDPDLRFPFLRIASRLLAKKLGFRYLMDVIPTCETLVRGSHGRVDSEESEWPVLISERSDLLSCQPGVGLPATRIKEVILQHVFNGE